MFGFVKKYRTFDLIDGGNKASKRRRLRTVRPWSPIRSEDGRVLTIPFIAFQAGPNACA